MKMGFANHPRKNIIEEIEWIGTNGFDFVDLFLEEDQAVPEKIDIREIKKVLQEHGLGAVGHTAWYLPIGSPIKAMREAAVAEARRYFELFSALSLEYVTVHANWPPALFSKDEGIALQVESLRKLAAEAQCLDIRLLYEPVDTRHDDAESISRILESVPNIYLHLDTGHANLFGRKPEDLIERFHTRLRHVHLNDNDGRSDLHIPPGTGSINWEQVIRILKRYYDGTVTLEVFSRDRDYALLSRDKLKKLWDSC